MTYQNKKLTLNPIEKFNILLAVDLLIHQYEYLQDTSPLVEENQVYLDIEEEKAMKKKIYDLDNAEIDVYELRGIHSALSYFAQYFSLNKKTDSVNVTMESVLEILRVEDEEGNY